MSSATSVLSTSVPTVPADRIVCLNQHVPRESGSYVLYWMTAYRRLSSNYALQHAVEWAGRLNKPLLILEALEADYPWSSPRFHHFIWQGMLNNGQVAQLAKTAYYPYIEPEPAAGKGLVRTLATEACLLVTDDYPCFFLPKLKRFCAALSTLALAVDSNGILPIRHPDRIFTTAYSFRRFLQKELPQFLVENPVADPLGYAIPSDSLEQLVSREIRERYPALPAKNGEKLVKAAEDRTFNPGVGATSLVGGNSAAREMLANFLATRLTGYPDRNHPDDDTQSHLSPYLHFGHISSHEIFDQLIGQYQWSLASLSETAKGSRTGRWNLPPEAEGFLDQLITWRELGFNMCAYNLVYAQYESLPGWALETLADHAGDPRPTTYSLAELESANTSDPIWNACQRQLVRDGFVHNYLRMLWGKKILQWSPDPREALETMIHLNNKYALDGRDPNSYSGIFWVLGRYDRAWGPERDIFGKVRYMTSESAQRKLRLKKYLEIYGAEQDSFAQD